MASEAIKPTRLLLKLVFINPSDILADASINTREICLSTAYAPGHNSDQVASRWASDDRSTREQKVSIYFRSECIECCWFVKRKLVFFSRHRVKSRTSFSFEKQSSDQRFERNTTSLLKMKGFCVHRHHLPAISTAGVLSCWCCTKHVVGNRESLLLLDQHIETKAWEIERHDLSA